MSNSTPTAREIEMWFPRCLEDFIGNEEIKNTLLNGLRLNGDGANILILGETGTAKTSFIECYLRTRNCPNVEDPMKGPCGKCHNCQTFDFSNSDEGLFAYGRLRTEGDKRVTHFFHLNCYELDDVSLQNLRLNITDYSGDRIIIYLDEVQELKNSRVSGMLLKMIRETEAIWLATGITSDDLSPMFVRRFAERCRTELPKAEVLALFLKKRCEEWSINYESCDTLASLAVASSGIPSECISVLAKASMTEGRLLDRQLVDNHHFISGVLKRNL